MANGHRYQPAVADENNNSSRRGSRRPGEGDQADKGARDHVTRGLCQPAQGSSSGRLQMQAVMSSEIRQRGLIPWGSRGQNWVQGG